MSNNDVLSVVLADDGALRFAAVVLGVEELGADGSCRALNNMGALSRV